MSEEDIFFPEDDEFLPAKTVAKDPASETAPVEPEEVENGCQWCDAEQCLHHHTFELPK